MASIVYNRGAKILVDGTVDWDGSPDVRAALVTSTYTPDKDHNTVSQLTNELSGGNYVRKVTASRVITENDASDRVELDLADITWTALQAAAGTPKYLILYLHDAGGDAASQLIAALDLGASPPTPNGGDYTVSFASNGAINLTT